MSEGICDGEGPPNRRIFHNLPSISTGFWRCTKGQQGISTAVVTKERMRELCSTLLAAQNDEAHAQGYSPPEEVLREYRELTHKNFLQVDGDNYTPMNSFSYGDAELVLRKRPRAS